MEPLPPASGRNTRLALVAAGLLVLLAVVAFASRSGFGGSSSRAAPSPGYVSYAFTAFLIVFALAIPLVVYSFLLQAREGHVGRKSYARRMLRNMAGILIFCVIAGVVLYAKSHHWHFFHVDFKAVRNTRKAFGSSRGNHAARYQPAFEWSVFWIAVVLVGAAAVAFLVVYLRRKRRPLIPMALGATVTEDLVETITDLIEGLEAEPDPRRAVIAAYARMESVLARHGLRRRPSETPLEYLRRVLLGLTERGDAVQRLTELFERAKFSTHEIDEGMKRDAIVALREIRDDL
jgi:hypothetical protein